MLGKADGSALNDALIRYLTETNYATAGQTVVLDFHRAVCCRERHFQIADGLGFKSVNAAVEHVSSVQRCAGIFGQRGARHSSEAGRTFRARTFVGRVMAEYPILATVGAC